MPWNDLDPAKDKARITVKRAVKAGRLVRPKNCSECNINCRPFAHHDDYSKPLDVIWLCQDCHVDRHWTIKKYGIRQILALEQTYALAVSVAKRLIFTTSLPRYKLNRGLSRAGQGTLI